MRLAVLLLALLVRCSPAAAAGARESADRVTEVFRDLRARPPRATTVTGARRVFVVVTALTPDNRRALEAAGLRIELPAPGAPAPAWHGDAVVQGTATPDAEATIARLPFVRRIDTPGVPWSNVGSVTTAGDGILLSDAARAVLATDGAGIRVGVISDGADARGASVVTGDLPADVAVVGGLAGRGNEGTALLEIVHDVAPGAPLLFAAPQTAVEMVAAIDAMRAAGARVIVDDLVFTDEPKFEDGPIALAARGFGGAGGVYVTSAGNFARLHYIGDYRPRAAPAYRGFVYKAIHAFARRDFGNSFRIPAGGDVLVVLQWNERFGQARDDFDLVLARTAAGSEVVLAASTEMQAGAGNPYEALHYRNGSTPVDAYVAIAEFTRVTPVADVRFDVHIFANLGVDLQYTVTRDSIFGHAAVEEVLSVAAAPADDPSRLERFSGEGPASIFFPTRQTRQVPRITAVDGVETAVGKRGLFANPFRGTSAAAPHVAGCIALLLAAGASASASIAAVQSTAVDLLAAGFDPVSGAGRLDCAAAGRLATARARAPVIVQLSARFDATGAVVVEAAGDDPDGDARAATVRFLDRNGDELAHESASPVASGNAFMLALSMRAAVLASARMVTVRVSDATRLSGVETPTTLACPGDASVGDAFCALGDLIAALGDDGSRLAHVAKRAAESAARAGRAVSRGRTPVARRALMQTAARVGTIARRARRSPDPAIADAASALRARLAALRSGLD